jgi:hypothetical protein
MSPQEIKEENSRRRRLKTKFGVKTKKKTQLITDPNAPKRPTTPFIYFFKEQYRPYGSKAGEFMKDCAERWKSLKDEDKRV